MFTTEERRVLLDLVDEEHSRDKRTFEKGRTTKEVWNEQFDLYWSLRRKLVAISPTDETPPG